MVKDFGVILSLGLNEKEEYQLKEMMLKSCLAGT